MSKKHSVFPSSLSSQLLAKESRRFGTTTALIEKRFGSHIFLDKTFIFLENYYMAHPFRTIKCFKIEHFSPGEEVLNPQPGDFILTRGNAWTSKLIQFGQMLRFHGNDKKYTRWNHAAIVINTQGDIIEALGSGVKKRHISVYKPKDYYYVRINAMPHDRDQAVNFALYALGEPYGWSTIVSIAISLITGLKFSFGFDGEQICSGLIARAMERTSAIFNRSPSHITPADLAKYYQVEPKNNVGSFLVPP